MSRREFAVIWPAVLARMAVALLLPLAGLVVDREFSDSNLMLLHISLLIAVVWTANALGVTAFKPEHRDRAWEYLLTFPFGRARLLLAKALPRLLVLGLLLGGYTISHHLVSLRLGDLRHFAPLDPVAVCCQALVLLICGFSLSPFEWRNVRILIGLPWFLLFLLLGWGLRDLSPSIFSPPGWPVYRAGMVTSAAAVVTIAALAGWRAFRRFDLQAEPIHLRRYLAVATPPALLLGLVAIMGIRT